MAGRYPAAWLEELRERSDIVQIVSGYVQLKKNGRNYWGLCPFHGEKTASFSVNPEQQFYYCFGCKAGGDVFHFVEEMERIDFGEAVALLAERAHIPLPEMEVDEGYELRKSQRERLLAANKLAARFYYDTLYTPAGEAALDYLKKRGLSSGVIRKFGIGAAPDEWDSLTNYLLENGFTLSELQLAGLTVVRPAEPASESGPAKKERVFDMFRNRAIFPIIDQYGNVLAFGGRTLTGQQPKYLNTSDTPVFNKRKGVYAANLLKKERHLDRVILVEGYMDVVSLTQFGITGVCATLGTALTNDQARLMKRFAPIVYLSYDGDSAGQHAILRGLDILREEGIPARVLDFPDGLDPDEFIRRDGADAFRSLPAVSGETYRRRRLKDELDLSTEEGRIRYCRESAVIIAPLDPVERESHIRELVVETGFPREVILDQIGLSLKDIPAEELPAVRAPLRPRRDREEAPPPDRKAQETLLSLYASGQLPEDIVTEEDFSDPELKLIYQDLRGGASVASLIGRAPDDEARSVLIRVLGSRPVRDTDEMIRMAHDCVSKIRLARYESRYKQVMSDSASCQDPEQKKQLLKEAQDLMSKMNRLKG